MYGYIYLTTNLINGKKYIGQHASPVFEPDRYIGSGVILWKAIKKYGKENFICELLESCDSADELNEKEEYWISYYNAVESDDYYNIAAGGNSSKKTVVYRQHLKESWTESRRNKQREKFKSSNPAKNPEVRKKISDNNASRNYDVRKKLSDAKLGKSNPHTDEWNKKISEALKGRVGKPCSKETKQKLSELRSGKNNPMYGKSATRGTKWFTNGIINVRRKECPAGFIPGVTKICKTDREGLYPGE